MDKIEIGGFLRLFNRGGYVLDFSTNDFDSFCLSSVGVALCQKYQLSKGKSLVAFCDEASSGDVRKLLCDLFEYYEFHFVGRPGEAEFLPLYSQCKRIYERERMAVTIETPAIILVDRDYIRDISTRAIRDVDNGEYDSAITKSRTLLEEVFCYVIEAKDIEPSSRGDIKKLYKQVKDIYNMHANASMDRRINELLSGLEKILDSIAEMRNASSDAHGVGQRRINILAHHARLFVNSAMTMADFILSVSET